MKRQIWAGWIILSLLLGACGTSAPAEPTFSADAVQSTAVAMAVTVIAQTQAAAPTDTLVPPPTEPPAPTDTPAPTATIEALASPTVLPTFTSQPAASGPTADPCNKTLSAWQGDSASLNIVYDYSPQGKDDRVVLSLWVMTDHGECGFLADTSNGPAGQYSAAAYIDGDKDFKVFGGFRITATTWDIVIRNDSIVALGSCYPNC